jgi:hypothetical protein
MEKIVLFNRETDQLEIVTEEELKDLKLAMFMAKRPFHIYYRILPEVYDTESGKFKR